MIEFLNSDFVYNNIALLLVGLACVISGICIFLGLRIDAKKEAFPHTMSHDEYVQLNEKRFNGAPSGSYGTGGPGGA